MWCRRSILVLVLSVFAASLAASIPFPHDGSDLRADPRARFGVLPSGLRYVIIPNREPKQRASLRLLIEAGAWHETDDQQGLAHFLEHMAFNGSRHYPPGTLVEYFQRLGMSFGGDTNASTSYNRTLYLLELPDTRDATIEEGLRVFRDYADGLLLSAAEIDRERGVILSEKRTRDSVGYRTSLATRNFLLAGTLFARRDIIGPVEVLQQAGRDRFLDFYDAWYRPELMAVVVAGDFEPAVVEQQLIAGLAGIAARSPVRPAPDLGRVPAFAGVRAFHHHEAEAPNTVVTVATLTPYAPEPDTSATRLRKLPRMLANAILNRRLSVLAKQEGAPFTGGSAGAGEYYGFYRQTVVTLTCRAEQWADALGVGERELRRALEHGFQGPELAEVVANFRNSLEQAVRTASTRRSDGVADEVSEALLDREVWTTAEDDRALFGPALERVTVADCLTAMREAWSPDHRLLLVTGNAALPDGAGGEAAIAAAYERSRGVAVAAPPVPDGAQWAYEDFGAPGQVVSRERVADLDVTLLTFANGVRLNLKRTEFEANRIRVNVRLGSGQLTEPRDQPGLGVYAGQIFVEGGLGRHSADDLRRLLAGRTVGVGFSVGGDAFTFAGATNREDLLLQFQLLAARITDPGYRPEAARQARKWIEQIYRSFEHTAGGPFTLDVARLLAGGDSRFGLPAREEMLRRNPAEVRAWLAPELSAGAMEVAVVGDFEPAEVIAAVGRTLGALPARQPRPELDGLRRVQFPREPFRREFAIATGIPKGEVAIYWPTTDGRDIRRARRLNLLAEVLGDRLRVKVRQELGEAYSPGAGSLAGDLYPDFGYIQASVSVDPPRAPEVAELVVRIAAELAERGVTADELARAQQPVLTSLRESARTNQYWLGSVLARAQEKPEVLDWCRHRYADHEAITAAELGEFARRFLGAERASRVVVVPASR